MVSKPGKPLHPILDRAHRKFTITIKADMKIHTYTSKEPMLKVNAFIIESKEGLVLIDTTLTKSDSLALKSLADSLGKPIRGIVLTHGHPDHVAGTGILVPAGGVPIYALASVKALMESTEAAKHQQWSGVFGAEWIPKWVYPDNLVKDGDKVTIGDVCLKVHDIGSGGDCDANSIWLLEGDSSAAFIGDFVYSQNHTFMADGSILRWLANLEKWAPALQAYKSYYVGHGPTCDYSALAAQRDYLLHYSARLLEIAGDSATVSEEATQKLTQDLVKRYPSYGCQFMIGLSLPSVLAELRSKSSC